MKERRMKNTKIYLWSRDNVTDPKCFDSWKTFLPKERWEKTLRPLKEEDRKTELAAWLLLYYALKEWGISSEEINAKGAYCYGIHGKPERKKEEVYFNLSHSGKYVICAVSKQEIGCDIEKIWETKWKLAKRFFSENEYNALQRAKQKGTKEENILFTRLWVLRESYAKKTGEGLGVLLGGMDFSEDAKSKAYFFESEYDGYRIAVCMAEKERVELIVCDTTIDNCFY